MALPTSLTTYCPSPSCLQLFKCPDLSCLPLLMSGLPTLRSWEGNCATDGIEDVALHGLALNMPNLKRASIVESSALQVLHVKSEPSSKETVLLECAFLVGLYFGNETIYSWRGDGRNQLDEVVGYLLTIKLYQRTTCTFRLVLRVRISFIGFYECWFCWWAGKSVVNDTMEIVAPKFEKNTKCKIDWFEEKQTQKRCKYHTRICEKIFFKSSGNICNPNGSTTSSKWRSKFGTPFGG